MGITEQINSIICAYLDEAQERSNHYKPTDGMFGLGKALKDDACHERFNASLRACVDQLQQEVSTHSQAMEVVSALLHGEEWQRDVDCTRLMLTAAQRYALPFIPRLDAGDAE